MHRKSLSFWGGDVQDYIDGLKVVVWALNHLLLTRLIPEAWAWAASSPRPETWEFFSWASWIVPQFHMKSKGIWTSLPQASLLVLLLPKLLEASSVFPSVFLLLTHLIITTQQGSSTPSLPSSLLTRCQMISHEVKALTMCQMNFKYLFLARSWEKKKKKEKK